MNLASTDVEEREPCDDGASLFFLVGQHWGMNTEVRTAHDAQGERVHRWLRHWQLCWSAQLAAQQETHRDTSGTSKAAAHRNLHDFHQNGPLAYLGHRLPEAVTSQMSAGSEAVSARMR